MNEQNLPSIQTQNFELTQREAKALMSSDLIPKEFKNNQANCMIAIQVAKNIGIDPFTAMQNMHMIHGKIGWSSAFIISALNSCGRFSPLRYEVKGEGAEMTCTAWAKDKETSERLDGPPVSMKMAKAEGWIDKSGSKWKTMPELMIRYRAAAFFGRLYAPDILNGMHMVEEIQDYGGNVPVKDITPPRGNSPEDVMNALDKKKKQIQPKQDEEPTIL